MSLFNQILDDIKSSMKRGEKSRLLCLRGIHSEIKNISINQRIEITDTVLIQCLSKEIKQRQSSIQMFTEGKRQDLVDQNKQEIEWISSYLPSALSTQELENTIQSVITDLGTNSQKDMGFIMKACRSKLEGQFFDSKSLSQLIQKFLT